MYLLEPFDVTPDVLTGTNIPEDDYAAWASGTAYVIGARVMRSHRIYEAIAASKGKDPVTDTANEAWIEVSATNRWKAFDRRLYDKTTGAGEVRYSLKVPVLSDAIALFGLDGESVIITVTDPVEGEIYRDTIALVKTGNIVDAWSYCFDPISYTDTVLRDGLPLFTGVTLTIRVLGSAQTEVGEIVVGRARKLGTTLVDTEIGFTDYSRKERDSWGNPTIVEKAYADRVKFRFSFPPDDAARVKALLAGVRAKPSVFYAGIDAGAYGTTVFGFFSDFSVPLTAGASFATLEIEGLV